MTSNLELFLGIANSNSEHEKPLLLVLAKQIARERAQEYPHRCHGRDGGAVVSFRDVAKDTMTDNELSTASAPVKRMMEHRVEESLHDLCNEGKLIYEGDRSYSLLKEDLK